MDLLYFSVQMIHEVDFSCGSSSVTVFMVILSCGVLGIKIFSNGSVMLFITLCNNRTLCLCFYDKKYKHIETIPDCGLDGSKRFLDSRKRIISPCPEWRLKTKR